MRKLKQKSLKKKYHVKGWDKFAGWVEGETEAFSHDQAASFVAWGAGIRQNYRLRVFIDSAEIVELATIPNQLELF